MEEALDLERLMDLALAQAALGEAAGEVPVGAVLVDANGEVIASAFNRPVSSHDPTAHAEVVALRAAAAKLGNYRLPGTTLVVTVEPCVMCAGALVNARVARVVFGAREPKWGAFGSRMDVRDLSLNHTIDCVPGIREAESAELLKQFFKRRRE